MKNNIKATVYFIIGLIGGCLSLVGMEYMYFSSNFLPVYIGKTYVIGNQIVRWWLYALLIVLLVLSVKLADYGMSFLVKKTLYKKKTLK